MTPGKVIAMSTGIVTTLGAVIAVVFWVSENVVWAADYSMNQQQNTEVLIQIQIDISEERLERLVDKFPSGVIPRDAQVRIDKFRKKIQRLENQQQIIDAQIMK